MLVENKFIFISIPRCASTAFYYSCLLQNINVSHLFNAWKNHNMNIDFKSINKKEIMNYIAHGHEPINEQIIKYGKDLPIISVKRDRHQRFYSLFKHVLFDLKRIGEYEVYDHFIKMNVDELFFFTSKDLITQSSRYDIINDYLLKNKLIDKKAILTEEYKMKDNFLFTRNSENKINYLVNIFDILLTPISFYHNHMKNITWFNFGDFGEMELWISDMIGKPFKMESANSSNYMECEIKMDDLFISRYNDIFDYYDLPKKQTTLL